jgi:small nuclear ribonucleoprotein (snRNP)-like protein
MKEDQMDVENVGIMQGFMDDFDEVLKQALAEDESVGADDDEYETGKMIDRTPGSPEILMNNLRGDMRSVDARREELADMVGYNAAMETPDEVLALLQSSLAGGQAGGIEALMGGMGGAAGMTPPVMGGGAPPMAGMPDMGAAMAMPQAPMPTGQAPLQMANGGYVQSFADGSDQDGVTPFGTETSYSYSPDMIDLARYETMRTLSKAPVEVPDLRSSMEQRLPLYQELIGGTDSENMTQAQMLAALSQAAFNYAGNVDAQGRPLRGSQAARLAGAFAPVPGQMAKLASEQAKEGRAVKLAALQAAEKDVENIRSSNAKLVESQRKIFSDILKNSGSSVWGKSGIGGSLNLINTPGLAASIADATASQGQANQWFTAMAQLEAAAKPRTERYTDDRGYVHEYQVPGTPIPQFALDATASYKALVSGNVPVPATPQSEESMANQIMGTATAVTEAGAEEAAAEEKGPALPGLTAMATKAAFPEWSRNETTVEAIDPRAHSYLRPGEETIYNAAYAGDVTGPVPAIFSTLAKVPLVGPMFGDMDVVQKRKFVETSVNQLTGGLRTNDRFNEGERKEIIQSLNVLPGIIDNREAYIAQLRGVDNVLNEIFDNARREMNSPTAQKTAVTTARARMEDIHNIRRILGMPLFVDNENDPRWQTLPAGTMVMSEGQWYKIGGGAQ